MGFHKVAGTSGTQPKKFHHRQGDGSAALRWGLGSFFRRMDVEGLDDALTLQPMGPVG